MSEKALALVSELKIKGKLPALDVNVGNICNLTADPFTCIADLTTVILRDCALTSSVISTANSALYAPSQPIKTVSAAINILGFEKVKSLSLGLGLIKQMSQNAQGRNLYRLFACSYFSGLFAMSLGRQARHGNPEELFVGGVLCGLPRLLLANGFPERYAAFERRINTDHMTPNQACMDEFGVTYDVLTAEVARFWDMPASISKVLNGTTPRDVNAALVAGGTQIADMMFGNSPGGGSALSGIEARLKTALKIPNFTLAEFVNKTCSDDANVKRFFKLNSKDVEMMVKIVEWGKVDSAQVASVLTYGAATQEMEEKVQDPALILGQYLTDLVLCMRKTPDINRLLLTAMEAILRCVRPDTVIVGFTNKQSQRVEGRFLLGASANMQPADFCVPVAEHTSPIIRCLQTKEPATVVIGKELSLPFLKKLNLEIVRLVPIVVLDNSIGLFVMGREKVEPYSAQEEMWLDAIVGNVAMGFERAKFSLKSGADATVT